MAMKKEAKAPREEEEAATMDSTVDTADTTIALPSADNDDEKPTKKKKKKSKEKSKKKSSRSDDDNNSDADAAADTAVDEPTTTKSKEERRTTKEAKKAAILSQIPTTDPDGIPYSKIQIRRMKRRVKHGLHPIASPEEEEELRQTKKRERVEEERLWGDDDVAAVAETTANNGVAEEGDDDEGVEQDGIMENNTENDGGQETEPSSANSIEPNKPKYRREIKNHNPPSKKTKRSKPVPPDYICQACKNEPTGGNNFTPHWIYDCPHKKNIKGCNAVAKQLRGLHAPDGRKVFVTGLPFECDEGGVKRFFEESMINKVGGSDVYELEHVKLLKFDDSKRCKGQAFLTFDSEEGAASALKLNNVMWREVAEPGMATGGGKKKKKGGEEVVVKKELRLKITKVMNRFVTKGLQKGKGVAKDGDWAGWRMGKKEEK